MGNNLKPIHPGKILLQDFLVPNGMSQRALAEKLHVDARRVNDIVRGRRTISGDTALRLAYFFGNSPEFWMDLQSEYDLIMARRAAGKKIERTVRPLKQECGA